MMKGQHPDAPPVPGRKPEPPAMTRAQILGENWHPPQIQPGPVVAGNTAAGVCSGGKCHRSTDNG